MCACVCVCLCVVCLCIMYEKNHERLHARGTRDNEERRIEPKYKPKPGNKSSSSSSPSSVNATLNTRRILARSRSNPAKKKNNCAASVALVNPIATKIRIYMCAAENNRSTSVQICQRLLLRIPRKRWNIVQTSINLSKTASSAAGFE